MNLEEKIKSIINEETAKITKPFPYRQPQIGFADAHDPMYLELSDLIGNKQVHPRELLPDAQTVIVYFIPYAEEMAKKARQNKDVPICQEWSDYYSITNDLLSRIGSRLKLEIEKMGYKVESQPPTNNYDDVNLMAKWAHKSSAVIAGIGTFGLNSLLVTKLGTMGRLNSFVTNAKLMPTKRPDTQYCLYYKNGKCKYCADHCPSGALSTNGIDKFRCDAYLCGKTVRDSQQGCPACSSGPCAVKGFE